MYGRLESYKGTNVYFHEICSFNSVEYFFNFPHYWFVTFCGFTSLDVLRVLTEPRS